MSAQSTMKVTQGDYGYFLSFTLQNNDGTAVDLTSATLEIAVQRPAASTTKFTGSMSIVDATSGTCRYQVADGDFDEQGRYYAEVMVTWSGKVLTFGNIVIDAAPSLPRE